MEQKLERKIQQLNRIQDSPQLLSDLFANNERNSSECLIMPHLESKYNAATILHSQEMQCAPQCQKWNRTLHGEREM
jgi:hypothetical protein